MQLRQSPRLDVDPELLAEREQPRSERKRVETAAKAKRRSVSGYVGRVIVGELGRS